MKKQTKKYKEDLENFGEPERTVDVYKYLGSLILLFVALMWIIKEIFLALYWILK